MTAACARPGTRCQCAEEPQHVSSVFAEEAGSCGELSVLVLSEAAPGLLTLTC